MTGFPASASPEPPGERALLVSPSWIGDMVLCLPGVQRLRARRPGLRLDVLAKPGVAALWPLCPSIGEVIALGPGLRGMREAAARLRARGYAAAWVVPNSWRSALVPWLAGIPERTGFRGRARGLWLTRSLPRPAGDPRRHQSRSVADLFCPGDAGDLPAPELRVPGPALEAARGALAGLPPPRFVLMPGAARGPSKRWPADRFAEIGRRLLRERGGSLLVCGGAGERSLCEEVARRAGGVSWAGRTPPGEWAALLRLCDLALCNDSGGMHLAAALGTAGVAVFGRTDPRVTGPLHPGMRVVQADAPGPLSRRIRREDGRARRVLESVSVERVWREALRALEGGMRDD